MGDERSDLEKVGMFEDGPYDTDVTLYRIKNFATLMGRDDTEMDDPLRLGGPFPVIPGPKLKAATNDWTFEGQFLSLWEDKEYEDPGAWRRRYAAEQAELNLSDDPYLTTVGTKSMNGLGTYYGTFFEEPMEAMSPETKDKAENDLEGVPNFLTNPGKKGTGYGYLDICFNPYPEYMEDPAFDVLEAKQKMREEFEERLVGDGPFIPAGAGQEYFDPNPFFDDQDPDGEVETYDWDRLAKDADSESFLEGPWIPSSYTKCICGNKDVMVPFERWPEYEEDEWQPVPQNVFRQFVPDEDKPNWIPSIGHRTRQTCSIMKKNITFRINSSNFHMW